jgi:hypothetical protein
MRVLVVALLFVVRCAFATEPLKLVTWNLEWFPGGSPGASLDAGADRMIAAQNALRVINPDILCLQEIRDWSVANELVSVLPGYYLAVVSAFGGKQQQVIATRLPVDSAWADVWKSSRHLDLPRGYSFAAIRLPNNVMLLTYSVHMKANGRDSLMEDISKREASAAQLIAHEQAMEKI